NEFRVIERELVKFSKDLCDKPRWLVLNKIDLLADKDFIRTRKEILDKLAWDGPVFDTSAVSGDGTEKLAQAIMRELKRISKKN
ncbi:GTPase ObgE, partial [Woeseiaceae bacterium]|nr:GTPase ObgE [Woeseiaceae bacterium]